MTQGTGEYNKVIRIMEADFVAIEKLATLHNRKPRAELHTILQEAGIVPKAKVSLEVKAR